MAPPKKLPLVFLITSSSPAAGSYFHPGIEMTMRGVLQAPSLSRYAVRRQVLAVIGTVLLCFGCVGIIVALVWLTVCKVQGTLPVLLDERAETFLYALPALLLSIAIAGAWFVIAALATPAEKTSPTSTLHPHGQLHRHLHA